MSLHENEMPSDYEAGFDPAYVMAVCERRHREGVYGPIFLTLDQQLALATLAAYSVKNRIDAWDEGFAAITPSSEDSGGRNWAHVGGAA